MISDSDFMLAVLRETPDEWVSQAELLRRSASARGCGMTVHSRAADLRARGHVIENRVERREGSRALSSYRLVTPSLSTPPGVAATPDGAESEGHLARPGSSADREPSFSSEPEGTSLDSSGSGSGTANAPPGRVAGASDPEPLFGDRAASQNRRPAWA